MSYDSAYLIDTFKSVLREFSHKLQEDENLSVAETELMSAFWNEADEKLYIALEVAMDDGDLIRRYIEIEAESEDFEHVGWREFESLTEGCTDITLSLK